MFVFTNIWDYLLYNTIVNNSIGILYVIFFVVYTGFISSNLIKYAVKLKLFEKFKYNGPFNFISCVIAMILGHIATIYTGKFVVYLIEKFSLY